MFSIFPDAVTRKISLPRITEVWLCSRINRYSTRRSWENVSTATQARSWSWRSLTIAVINRWTSPRKSFHCGLLLCRRLPQFHHPLANECGSHSPRIFPRKNKEKLILTTTGISLVAYYQIRFSMKGVIIIVVRCSSRWQQIKTFDIVS